MLEMMLRAILGTVLCVMMGSIGIDMMLCVVRKPLTFQFLEDMYKKVQNFLK